MSDPCCWACRTPQGVCRNRTCDHHIAYEKQADIDHRSRQTYRDPTSSGMTGLERRYPRRRR